uniref:Acyltransferase n=1 Tax=Chrysotila carterae TaxID=13221 RepID=A0A7S4FBP6_CHRCT|mmetsp:Transcript_25427/g.53197  ORF Transcript_25427/g.53197 Transcript_25427/m.53197 type:complete len:331 (+) Transcript_25427:121-1113(+)
MAGSALIRLKVSALYLRNLFWPILLASIAFAYRPAETVLASVVALATFLLYATFDAAEFSDGRPDETFSKTSWLFCTMREYLQLTLHRTDEVQQKLIAVHPPTGQAIFSFFPHGVNSDFRVLMDGMMYDAFAKLYERAPARTLAASVLFKIPFVRKVSLATACVDAGRNTADKVIRNGRSVLVCPGGQDEQLETIYGRERVFLRKRSGFIRLAIVHGLPVVPAYCFGSSDLYFTSRAAHALRLWLVRTLRIAIPLYWGDWGFFYYPTPKGFPREVPQHVVFGDPLTFEQRDNPTKEEVAAAHDAFIKALVLLFDTHKARFGYAERSLEVL